MNPLSPVRFGQVIPFIVVNPKGQPVPINWADLGMWDIEQFDFGLAKQLNQSQLEGIDNITLSEKGRQDNDLVASNPVTPQAGQPNYLLTNDDATAWLNLGEDDCNALTTAQLAERAQGVPTVFVEVDYDPNSPVLDPKNQTLKANRVYLQPTS
ncbi:MAG: hypothetical protein U0003_04760 [Vampirovibrionales bacterium]